MTNRFTRSNLGQQLAIIAAALCLLIALGLIALSAISGRHMQLQLQENHGAALAQLIARRISNAMENGDLLSVSASLQRFVAISAADQIVITDVEGKTLGQAGAPSGRTRREYTAPVTIESDVAGTVTLSMNADEAGAALNQLILSLLGLAILMSLAIYGGVRHYGQRLGQRLASMARTINLEDKDAVRPAANELIHLEHQIQALPMDLLRTRSEPGQQDENYRTTAVLYLHLSSLAEYLDTLDEHALQRYTHRIHQVVYAAAGFYAGDIHVARQFGLAVYFSGDNKAGSAAFRATSCAWLIGAVMREVGKKATLSTDIAMAVSQSELGIGNGEDIYPGLYMQHTLDELQEICARQPDGILLAPVLREDVDIASRLKTKSAGIGNYGIAEEFAGNYRDLLERQLRLILRKLSQ